MYVSGITLANSSNVNPKNSISKNKANYSQIALNSTSKGKDKVAFGDGLSWVAQDLIQRIGEGLLGVIKNEYVINKTRNLFYEKDIMSGLEVSTKLNDKIGGSFLRRLNSFDDFIDTAVYYADKLPDHEYANRDIKQRFIRSLFTANHSRSHGSGSSIETAYVLPSAKRMFKNLNSYYYSDFKKNLISDVVERRGYILEDADELLADSADSSFKSKIKLKVQNLVKEDEKQRNDYQDMWDGRGMIG